MWRWKPAWYAGLQWIHEQLSTSLMLAVRLDFQWLEKHISYRPTWVFMSERDNLGSLRRSSMGKRGLWAHIHVHSLWSAP